jgi:hypothetical protein
MASIIAALSMVPAQRAAAGVGMCVARSRELTLPTVAPSRDIDCVIVT